MTTPDQEVVLELRRRRKPIATHRDLKMSHKPRIQTREEVERTYSWSANHYRR